jgi:outer membrane autotransporter protein
LLVIGPIDLSAASQTAVNFQGGNWLFAIAVKAANGTLAGTAVNTNGAPFVVSGQQVAVLDPTSFALADRALTNFTGEVQQALQGRFDGMGVVGGGNAALGFASSPSTPGIADEATEAFSAIPTVAMSYASDPRPAVGKAPAAATPYYDTTVWFSSFGGERKQDADGAVLPATDLAFGGTLGVDRAFGPNLRLGGFLGGGASFENVELNVQTINSTYTFGGSYGRFDWVSQYLDFSLYGGGINNSSMRQVAKNTAFSGLEVATANYGCWFISPALSYGFCIPLNNNILMTPLLSVRYVGGSLDGYGESGSAQDLSVGRRAINDLEERSEVEFSTLKPVSFGGMVKSTIGIGAIGLERLGNQTIDTGLLGQNLSFATPGQASAVGRVVDAGIQYHPVGSISLFISAEGTAMSDRSYSGAATGGTRVSF